MCVCVCVSEPSTDMVLNIERLHIITHSIYIGTSYNTFVCVCVCVCVGDCEK